MQTPDDHGVSIRVELEIGGAPPRGSALHGTDQPQPFWGWLELMHVLENLIDPALRRPQEASKARRDGNQTPLPRSDSGTTTVNCFAP